MYHRGPDMGATIPREAEIPVNTVILSISRMCTLGSAVAAIPTCLFSLGFH